VEHELDHYFEDSSTDAVATVANDLIDGLQLSDNARTSMISHNRDWCVRAPHLKARAWRRRLYHQTVFR
jgi:hypothetical protein